jgi:hypothetical protein
MLMDVDDDLRAYPRPKVSAEPVPKKNRIDPAHIGAIIKNAAAD